jgi:hypothetical protein
VVLIIHPAIWIVIHNMLVFRNKGPQECSVAMIFSHNGGTIPFMEAESIDQHSSANRPSPWFYLTNYPNQEIV